MRGVRRHRDISMITALTCQNLIVEWSSSEGVEKGLHRGVKGVKKRWNQKRETITQSLTGRKSTDLPSRQMYQIASRTFCLFLLCHVCSNQQLWFVCCVLPFIHEYAHVRIFAQPRILSSFSNIDPPLRRYCFSYILYTPAGE